MSLMRANASATFKTAARLPAAMLLLALLMLAGRTPAAAQEAVPRIDDAELVFTQAVQAFDEGDYGMAYRRFRLVSTAYPLNRKTTASIVMAAKAQYREGQVAEAAALLEQFLRQFPTSGYRDEAQRTLALAREQLGGTRPVAQPLALGIVLPTSDDDLALTQALFNGIRLAVDEYNRNEGGRRPARMVFRNSNDEPAAARQAVGDVVRQGARAIIGPLYSEEAAAAAEAAEAAGVVLLAPLANDEAVARGRRYVFQANPAIPMRGRIMARFAVQELGVRSFGVAAMRGNSISERMAEGFQIEAKQLGARVDFSCLLGESSAWSQLAAQLGPEALAQVEALYLPLSGTSAPSLIRSALGSLARADVQLRLLGDAEWHDLPIAPQASRFGTVYANDFYVDADDPAVRAFKQHYQDLTGRSLDRLSFTERRLAYTGYDVARFLLAQMAKGGAVAEAINAAPRYQGLGIRLDFSEGNVNTAMYFHRYDAAGDVLIR